MSTMEFEDYPPFLSTSQAAEMLSLSVSHLRHLARTGKIPARRMGNRDLRFLRDELIEWVNSLPSGKLPAEEKHESST